MEEWADRNNLWNLFFLQLLNHQEEYNTVNKGYTEEIQILSESMQKHIEDYEKALYDCKLNEDTKEEIKKLTIGLEDHRENYVQTFQHLKESFIKEIEVLFIIHSFYLQTGYNFYEVIYLLDIWLVHFTTDALNTF